MGEQRGNRGAQSTGCSTSDMHHEILQLQGREDSMQLGQADLQICWMRGAVWWRR